MNTRIACIPLKQLCPALPVRVRPVPGGALVSLGCFLRADIRHCRVGCCRTRGRSRRGLGRTLGSGRMGTRTEMDGSGRHRGPSGRSEMNGNLFPFRADTHSDSFVLETEKQPCRPAPCFLAGGGCFGVVLGHGLFSIQCRSADSRWSGAEQWSLIRIQLVLQIPV